MPIKKSAVKTLRQSRQKRHRNFQVKTRLKDLRKKALKLAGQKENKTAAEKTKEALKAFDRAVQKGIIKKNTAARKKSRLVKKVFKS